MRGRGYDTEGWWYERGDMIQRDGGIREGRGYDTEGWWYTGGREDMRGLENKNKRYLRERRERVRRCEREKE